MDAVEAALKHLEELLQAHASQSQEWRATMIFEAIDVSGSTRKDYALAARRLIIADHKDSELLRRILPELHAKRLIQVRPIRFLPELEKWEALEPIGENEMTEIIERAEAVGYDCESSLIDVPPYTHRISVHDPTGAGHHKEYFARIES